MNLEVGYFSENENIFIFGQQHQIYPETYFTVNIDKSHVQPINARFYVDILDDNSFRLTSSENEGWLYNYVDNMIVSEFREMKIDTICRYNVPISNRNFNFSISLNKDLYAEKKLGDSRLYFEFYHLDFLTKEYLKKLIIEPVN